MFAKAQVWKWGIAGGLLAVLAACQPAEEAITLPTLQVLPSLTVTSSPTNTLEPPTATPVPPTPTEQRGVAMFISSVDPVGVYDCPALDCGIVALLYPQNSVEILETDGGWHLVRLSQGFTGYLPAEYTSETLEIADVPTESPTATVTAPPPSATPIPTLSMEVAQTLYAAFFDQLVQFFTDSQTALVMSPTDTPTPGNSPTPLSTLPPAAAPTIPPTSANPVVIPPSNNNNEITDETQTEPTQPAPPIQSLTQPVAPTSTFTHTPSPTLTWTLDAPPTGQSTAAPLTQVGPPQTVGPPPGSGNPPPTSGSVPPTSSGPPQVITPPPLPVGPTSTLNSQPPPGSGPPPVGP
ncbi:MAG: hypothetical protein GYB67_09100 [Chloroflexi bacterium]|nr:hypothetical protein [Chloroflexota bacterium]